MNDMIKPLKLLEFGNMFRQTYRPIHHFLIVLISLMFWLLPQSHAEPIDTQSIELQLNLNAAKISLNEPVLIDVQFKNLSNTPINMELGSNSITAFELSIKGPNETSFQRYKFVPPWGASGVRSIAVEPETNYQDTIIADKWYDFNSPGLYEIRPHLVSSYNMPGKYHIKVNTVMKLQITPRDEKRLKRRASELLALALSDEQPNLSDIAERLSYLQDTVAINAFERLLRETSSRTQRFAVKGLMRIADLQSTHLLIKYQDKTEASGDRFITHALNKIANNSNDPEIVALAKSAADKYRIRSKATWFNY